MSVVHVTIGTRLPHSHVHPPPCTLCRHVAFILSRRIMLLLINPIASTRFMAFYRKLETDVWLIETGVMRGVTVALGFLL